MSNREYLIEVARYLLSEPADPEEKARRHRLWGIGGVPALPGIYWKKQKELAELRRAKKGQAPA